MGQYWAWLCRDRREYIYPYEFGIGAKYMEQLLSGRMHAAIILLNTDMSSLGHGGGDLCLSTQVHPVLRRFVARVAGRWFAKTVDFVGDYTEIETLTLDSDQYTDISRRVAAAVWAIEFSEWLRNHGPNAKKEFLSTHCNICMQHHVALQDVLRAADAIDWSTWSAPDDDDEDGPIVKRRRKSATEAH